MEQAHKAQSPEGRIITAGFVVIGDEILSGRTHDKNIAYLAEFLTGLGIDLKEVRIVPDEEDRIIEAVNALRPRYTYIFTSGGIGPTHDDITADSIAKAFDTGIDHDPRAVAMLEERVGKEGLTEARLRMARIPTGADLIENPVSHAPGFHIGNVFVMAGVPTIMQAMLQELAPTLEHSTRMVSRSVECPLPESYIADPLRKIQEKFGKEVVIGSYPQSNNGIYSTQLVIRSRNETRLAEAEAAVKAAVDAALKQQ